MRAVEHTEHPRARVAVVDDDEVARSALVAFLRRQSAFDVVGEAPDGRAGVDLFLRVRPDVMLMDLNMPVLSGSEATQQICAQAPAACVVVLTTFDAGDHVLASLRAGAAGYLLKDSTPADILEALHQALAGEMPLSPAVRRALVAAATTDRSRVAARPDLALTPRQTELVGWLAQGLTNQQIARRMHLSEGSVKQYLSAIGTRLGMSTRTQILIRSVQLGIVDPMAEPPRS